MTVALDRVKKQKWSPQTNGCVNEQQQVGRGTCDLVKILESKAFCRFLTCDLFHRVQHMYLGDLNLPALCIVSREIISDLQALVLVFFFLFYALRTRSQTIEFTTRFF